MAAKRKLSAKELDALHDSGADMSSHLDTRASRRPGLEIQRVNVDFPIWMIESLDQEAGRLGVPRQSVIKFWISECLASMRTRHRVGIAEFRRVLSKVPSVTPDPGDEL